MSASAALTVIALAVAVLAAAQVVLVLALLHLAQALARAARDLGDRALALQRLAQEAAERVGGAADEVGATARRLNQVGATLRSVLQGAAGAWALRRLVSGRGRAAAAALQVASGGRLGTAKVLVDLVGAVLRAVSALRRPAAEAAAARDPSDGPPGGRARRSAVAPAQGPTETTSPDDVMRTR